MLDVIFETFWIWYLTGVALWAYLGLLAASRQRLPLGLGAACGAVMWFVGVAAVLLYGVARKTARSRTQPVSYATPMSFAGSEYSDWSAYPADSGQWSGVASQPTPAWMAGGTGTASAAPDPWGWPTDQAATARALPASVRPADRVPTLLAVTGGVAAALMLVSIFAPWGRGRVAWSTAHRHVDGTVAPSSTGFVAVLIALTVVVVVGGVFGAYRAPRGVWPGAIAVVTSFWVALILEWFVVSSEVSSTTSTFDDVSGDRASVAISTSYGAWLMLGACLLIALWCVATALRVNDGRKVLIGGRSVDV